MSLLLVTGLSASAATITSFSVNPSSGTFNETLNYVIKGDTAFVTNSTISCVSEAGCSGSAFTFLGTVTGLSAAAPFTAYIDGTLSGSTAGAGQITLTQPSAAKIPFTIEPLSVTGPNGFNKTLAKNKFPGGETGTQNFAGDFSLTLAPSQTLTLPSSLAFSFADPAAAAIPEPGTMGLLGFGLAGLGVVIRRRRAIK